ncbi:MAG: prepilin peptidase [Ruminococcaceae bacterium]|nr:prepilin peptidase [Oscillospiraceae bacterium]
MKTSDNRKFFYIAVTLFPFTVFTIKLVSTNLLLGAKLSIAFCVAAICMCAAEDLISRTIPDFSSAVIFISGIAFTFFTKGIRNTPFAILKTGVFFIILIIVFHIAKGGIGGGDVKLVAASSAFIGPMNAVWITAFAAMLASPLGVILIITKRRQNKKTEQPLTLPFGPFYAICFLVELYNIL